MQLRGVPSASSVRRQVYCSPNASRVFSANETHPGMDLYRQGLHSRNRVVDVDPFEHRKADDAALVLTDRTVSEPRRIECVGIAEIEPVFDQGPSARKIGDRLFQPAKRLAQPCIDRLEALDIDAVLGRYLYRLVSNAQLVE